MKPCPFCGNKDVDIEKMTEDSYAVYCYDCACTGPLEGNEFAAVNKWEIRVEKEDGNLSNM